MSYNPFSLEGKTILIVGASSGIGRQTAIECSRLGARVIVCARNTKALNETLSLMEGHNHNLVSADLTNTPVVERLVEEIQVINGVVLSVGKGLTLPLKFSTKEKFDDVFSTNLFSQVELLRLLIRKKKIAHEGSVVFVGSVGGVKVFNVGGSVYGASKAAIDSIMKFCAKELAPQKIRVNSVNPGMTKTNFIHRGSLSEEQFESDMQNYPLKRYGEPSDIAFGIVYLLSDAASWVTGHALCIDGGVSI